MNRLVFAAGFYAVSVAVILVFLAGANRRADLREAGRLALVPPMDPTEVDAMREPSASRGNSLHLDKP